MEANVLNFVDFLLQFHQKNVYAIKSRQKCIFYTMYYNYILKWFENRRLHMYYLFTLLLCILNLSGFSASYSNVICYWLRE